MDRPDQEMPRISGGEERGSFRRAVASRKGKIVTPKGYETTSIVRPSAKALMESAAKRGGQISELLQAGDAGLLDNFEGFKMGAEASRAEVIEEVIHLKAKGLGLPYQGLEGGRYAKGLMLRFRKTFGLSDRDAQIIKAMLDNYEGR